MNQRNHMSQGSQVKHNPQPITINMFPKNQNEYESNN